MSSSTRTYSQALEKLSLLKSNRTIVDLFGNSSSPPKDLNAAAIPEMLHWLQRAGYTPKDLAKMKHIHVAGTKGKGSVCTFAAEMLRCHFGGERKVGLYTSPHLVSPRERIAIDGSPVSTEIFTRAFFDIWDRLGEAAKREGLSAAEAEGPGTKPFFFRFLTIMAWHIFLEQGVQDVVLECGIGGEYDSTNVVPGDAVSAAVVAQLGIDHVAMLGDTAEKIAWHKAGVSKEGVTAFTRRLEGQGEVMDVLRARAAEKGAKLVEVRDEDIEAWGGVDGKLKGGFQKYNQALAVLAVKKHLGLQVEGPSSLVPTEAMERGLREAKIRGRAEVVQDQSSLWYIDGAHTKESVEEAARWFATAIQPQDTPVLLFNQQDRDISQLLTEFVAAMQEVTGRRDIFNYSIFTTNNLERERNGQGTDTSAQQRAAATMAAILPSCRTKVCDNIEDAVSEARKAGSKILVTGSLYLAGGVLQALEPASLL